MPIITPYPKYYPNYKIKKDDYITNGQHYYATDDGDENLNHDIDLKGKDQILDLYVKNDHTNPVLDHYVKNDHSNLDTNHLSVYAGRGNIVNVHTKGGTGASIYLDANSQAYFYGSGDHKVDMLGTNTSVNNIDPNNLTVLRLGEKSGTINNPGGGNITEFP